MYSASGKLMLFGEYLVLRGSRCISVPLKVNQHLLVTPISDKNIQWESIDEKGNCWFSAEFSIDIEIVKSTNKRTAEMVQKLLRLILKLQPNTGVQGKCFTLNLEFNKHFGWGTSSTLISLLSQWADVDPYYLLEHSFGGSGYDIATANAESTIVYSVKRRTELAFTLPKSITSQLLFVYLGEKQISSEEITLFKNKITTKNQIAEMNAIINTAVQCTNVNEWENLMKKSEVLLSSILEVQTVKALYFSDYPHAIKSLGAWGGDFIMATYRDFEQAKNYFQSKNKPIIYSYEELIL